MGCDAVDNIAIQSTTCDKALIVRPNEYGARVQICELATNGTGRYKKRSNVLRHCSGTLPDEIYHVDGYIA
jgi:hypothetical protein